VEGVGDPQETGELDDHPLLPGLERREGRVAVGPGAASPVVAGDVGDDLDLPRIEGVQGGVGDEVVAVLVVAVVVGRVADGGGWRRAAYSSHSRSRGPRPWTERVRSKSRTARRADWRSWARTLSLRSASWSTCRRLKSSGSRAKGIGWPRAARTSPSRRARSQ